MFQEKPCQHCGTPFVPTEAEREFCCQGCRYVHGLITRQDLGRFYDLKDRVLAPVGNSVFEPAQLDWLTREIEAAELRSSGKEAELSLSIQGISCVACTWLIQRIFEESPGGLDIHVQPTRGTVQLRWQPGRFDGGTFASTLRQFGYRLGPFQDKPTHDDLSDLGRRLGLTAAFALNAMLFTLPGYLGLSREAWLAPLLDMVVFLCATLSMAVGGSYFIFRSWRAVQARVIHIDLPIALGLLFAYAGSFTGWLTGDPSFIYFDFVAIFCFLMLGGRYLQEKSVVRNRNRLLEQESFQPTVYADGNPDVVLPLDTIKPGTRFHLRPGDILPVSARLENERIEFSLEWINGEPEPRLFRPGQTVRSGSLLLGDQPALLTAEETWNDSLLCRLTRETSAGGRAAEQRNQLIRVYLFVILGAATLAFSGWLVETGDLGRSLQVLISILVVSCPCAIGVALPLATELATQAARKAGVFVVRGSFWNRMPSLKKIVFDKTGTLSLDTLEWVNREVMESLDLPAREVLARLVQFSRHPVARCLRAELQAAGVGASSTMTNVREIPGAGIEGCEDGHSWRLGKAEWAASADEPGTVFSRDGSILARFQTRENIRADARDECSRLQHLGYRVYILSGDQPGNVRRVAEALGLSDEAVRAAMDPDEKAAWVREHDTQDTLMIGDGANDSLAFESAWCRGTPAIDAGLLEHKADFYFLGTTLRGIRAVLETGHHRLRAVRAVLTFTILYNMIALTICILGLMNPLLAAILMPLSSIVSLGIVAGRKR